MPYLPDVRQYRSFAASNFQPIEREAMQDGQEPSYQVRGYFCTFNDEYILYPAIPSCDWPATYEQIDRHAFDTCDISDVIAQYDHSGDVLARTRNGSLKIGFDDHGGYCEMRLDGCQRARDMYESICNGLVVEMSFGFAIADDDEGQGRTHTVDEQGDYHVTITRIAKCYDVSCVSIPANPGTDIESIRKRSYMASVIEADIKARKALVNSEPDEQPDETHVIEGVTESFSIDYEDVANRVADILSMKTRESLERKLEVEPETPEEPVETEVPAEPELTPEEAQQALEEAEQRRASEMRRKRRMRALKLIEI